uniref:Uncharacterized protein n=1 Tax=Lepeophtheirus salmonis TaxID=72036 RepID=A0A0K2TKB1_LEPSM
MYTAMVGLKEAFDLYFESRICFFRSPIFQIQSRVFRRTQVHNPGS